MTFSLRSTSSAAKPCCCFPAATITMAISATRPISGAPRKCWDTSATANASSLIARCALADQVEDFIAVRRATLSLLRNLDATAWMRRGIANKNEVTVRALAYIIAGHELHHRRILEEKYFAASR